MGLNAREINAEGGGRGRHLGPAGRCDGYITGNNEVAYRRKYIAPKTRIFDTDQINMEWG